VLAAKISKGFSWFSSSCSGSIAQQTAQKTVQVAEGRVIPKAIPSLDTLSKAGQVLDKNNLTKAGRALQKHGDRPASVFSKATGNHVNKNMQGQFHLDDILTHPYNYSKPNRLGGIDYYKPDGSGVRFYEDYRLRGFLEPNL
jgi:hypothetical protein